MTSQPADKPGSALAAPRDWQRFVDDDKTPILALAAPHWPPPLAVPPAARLSRKLAVTPRREPIVVRLRTEPPSAPSVSLGPHATSPTVGAGRGSRASWYFASVLGVLLCVNALQGSVPATAQAGESPPSSTELAAGPRGIELARERARADAPTRSAASSVKRAHPDTTPGRATSAEALTHAARAAHDQGRFAEAAATYTRALQANASYFPASLGLADSQWELGNKRAAQLEYRRMVASFPASMVPDRARLRAGGPAVL